MDRKAQERQSVGWLLLQGCHWQEDPTGKRLEQGPLEATRTGGEGKPGDRQALQIGKASELMPILLFSVPNPRNDKAPTSRGFIFKFGGKPGIRTLGTLLTFAGFQDCRLNNINQQLSHSSFPHLSNFRCPTSRAYQGPRIRLRK